MLRQRLLFILFLFLELNSFSQWTDITPSYSTNGMSIEFVNANVGFSSGARISKTIDGGNTWTKYLSGDPLFDNYSSIIKVKFRTPTEGYAVGYHALNDDELIFHTTDAGSTWQLAFESSDNHFSALVDNLVDIDYDGNRIFGVGGTEGGEIDYSLNNGITWDTIQVPNDYGLLDVLLEPLSNNVLFGGEEGIYYSNDNCNSYIQVSTYPCFDMEFINDSTIISVGYSFVQISTDHGLTWNNINYGGSHLYNVEVLNEDTIFVAGIGEVYRTTNQGYSWELMVSLTKPTIQFNDFQVVDGQTAFISGRNPLDVNDYFLGKTATGFGDGEPMVNFTNSNGQCPDQLMVFTNYGDTSYSYTWYVDSIPVSNNYNFDTIFGPNENHTVMLEADNGALTNQSNDIIQTSGGIDLSSHYITFGYDGDTLCVQLSLTFTVYNSVVGANYRLLLDSSQLGNSVYANGLNSSFSFVTNTYWVPTGDLYFVIECSKSNQCDTVVRLDSFYVHIPPPIIPITISVESDSICEGGDIIFTIDTSQINANYTIKYGCGGQFTPIQTYIGTGNSITDTISSDLFPNSCSSLYLNAEIGYYCPIPSSASTSNNVLIQLQTIQNQVSIPNVNYINDTVYIDNSSDSSYLITWDFGSSANQQYSTEFEPDSISFPSGGLKPVYYTMTNYLGCNLTDTTHVTVLQKISEISLSVCDTSSVTDYISVINISSTPQNEIKKMAVSDNGTMYQIQNRFLLQQRPNDSMYIFLPSHSTSSSFYNNFIDVEPLGNGFLVAGYTNSAAVGINGQSYSFSYVAPSGLYVNSQGYIAYVDSLDSVKWVISSPTFSNNGKPFITDMSVDPFGNIVFYANNTMLVFSDSLEVELEGPLVKMDKNGKYISSAPAYPALRYFNFMYSGGWTITLSSTTPNIEIDCEGNIYIASNSSGIHVSKHSNLLSQTLDKQLDIFNSGTWTYGDEMNIASKGTDLYCSFQLGRLNYGDSEDTLFINNDTVIRHGPIGVIVKLDDSLNILWYKVFENYNIVDIAVLDSTLLCYGDARDYVVFDTTNYQGTICIDRDLLFLELDQLSGNVSNSKTVGGTNSTWTYKFGDELAGAMAMSDSGKMIISYITDTIDFDSISFNYPELKIVLQEIALNSICAPYDMTNIGCDTPTNVLFETNSDDTLCIFESINFSLLNPINDTISISLLYNNGLNSTIIDSNIISLNYTGNFSVPDTLNGQNLAFIASYGNFSDTTNYIWIKPNFMYVSPQETVACAGGDTLKFYAGGGSIIQWQNFQWQSYINYTDSLYFFDPFNGYNNVQVRIIDTMGCDITLPIDIQKVYLDLYIQDSNIAKCENQDVSTIITSNSADSIFVSGNYLNTSSFSYSLNQDTVFQVEAINNFGCVLRDSIVVNMSQNNIVFYNVTDTLVCSNSELLSISASTSLNPFVWAIGFMYSGNGMIGNYFNPQLAGTGTHEITVTFNDNGCIHTNSIFITVDECLSVLENSNINNGIKMFPNPARNKLNILIPNEITLEKGDLFVLKSSLGKILLKEKLTDNYFRVNLSNYPAGVYFIEILNTTYKVIKE